MTRLSLLPALAALAFACVDAPSTDPCAVSEAHTDRYISVDASLVGPSAVAEPIDCATFTVTQPDSAWRVTGATPSEVDLAPGTYVVEVDWAEGHRAYRSRPVTVTLDDEPEEAALDLCLDVSGDWTCSSGAEQWSEVATMNDGCDVTLEHTGAKGSVVGHLIQGQASGTIDADGQSLEIADQAGRIVTCSR